MAEMGVRVVHGRRAMRGPARVRNAETAFQLGRGHLLHQLGHAGGAAGALQACGLLRVAAIGIHRYPAGVITPVFEAL